MRIFISYARVDKPLCIEIMDQLHVYEVWSDQRLYAGVGWWREILRRLEWTECFIYLLSPESLASTWCQKEYQIAQSLARHIIPVKIHTDAIIPEELRHLEYADFSQGVTANAVRTLLNAVYVASRKPLPDPSHTIKSISPEVLQTPMVDDKQVIEQATEAMERGEYEKAIFLLKHAKASGGVSTFIPIDKFLKEAERALELKTEDRKKRRFYNQISALVKIDLTQDLGCDTFEEFQKVYPGYDPDDLSSKCFPTNLTETIIIDDPLPPEPPAWNLKMLEWCSIPAGIVRIEGINKDEQRADFPLSVMAFEISKYPVTNEQYQEFIDAEDGYCNADWWKYSKYAYEWRTTNTQPQPSTFKGDERPREMANWYDAMAFCRWLSARLSVPITLPTIPQRQRAIQGDDERVFPWGDTFDKNKCNTHESDMKMTTLVTRYPEGVSPYGVFDLAGNVWEWCLNSRHENGNGVDITLNEKRAVHGGSFVSPYQRARINFHYYLNPQIHYASIGFRIVKHSS